MATRKIVHINDEFCNGCGQCIIECAEGALQIVDGKARLLSDNYCDGLGACLGHCPQDAISIVERNAKPFDEKAVHIHLLDQETLKVESPLKLVQSLNTTTAKSPSDKPPLRNWPIQLNLVPLKASFFDDSDLLVMADCVPVVYSSIHDSLLLDKSVVIGCPKFDDAEGYMKKLGEILKRNNVKSVTVAHMEVPCCFSLYWIVKRAIANSEKKIPLKLCIISKKGEIKSFG